MTAAIALLTLCLPNAQVTAQEAPALENADRVQPYSENPRYWQYRGEPVMLLGGSKDDNLFQIPDLEEHLDLLQSVGGNCIRNTMSDRRDFDFEVYPFKQLDDGKYDLEQWNEEYWRRFETMLKLTHERDIFVQIEVWDRFDYSQANWEVHPYNPANNVNYTPEESGLAEAYPAPAWRDKQPFFHSIPGMPLYNERLDRVRYFQALFVGEMAFRAAHYGHVLYCMDNETSTPVAWGKHWMELIRYVAEGQSALVHVTDMFDDVWEPHRSAKLKHAIDSPETYLFIDVSQINSRNFGQDHWDGFQWISEQVPDRPLTCTKIYSDGNTSWGSGTPKEGVERFWRNLLGGAASCRFHRDGGGIGLRELAQNCIRAGRLAESLVKPWDVVPHMELLSDRDENEAYLAAKPGEQYLVFITDGGSVGLDLTGAPGAFTGRWVNINAGEWGEELTLTGGAVVAIQAPAAGPWAAVISGQQ